MDQNYPGPWELLVLAANCTANRVAKATYSQKQLVLLWCYAAPCLFWVWNKKGSQFLHNAHLNEKGIGIPLGPLWIIAHYFLKIFFRLYCCAFSWYILIFSCKLSFRSPLWWGGCVARAPPRWLWLSHPPGSTFFTNVLYDLLGWMFCQWDFSCLRGVSLFSNLGLRTEDFFLLCSADLTWHAFCQICCINISVNHRGRPDIVRHWEADKYRGRAQTL